MIIIAFSPMMEVCAKKCGKDQIYNLDASSCDAVDMAHKNCIGSLIINQLNDKKINTVTVTEIESNTITYTYNTDQNGYTGCKATVIKFPCNSNAKGFTIDASNCATVDVNCLKPLLVNYLKSNYSIRNSDINIEKIDLNNGTVYFNLYNDYYDGCTATIYTGPSCPSSLSTTKAITLDNQCSAAWTEISGQFPTSIDDYTFNSLTCSDNTIEADGSTHTANYSLTKDGQTLTCPQQFTVKNVPACPSAAISLTYDVDVTGQTVLSDIADKIGLSCESLSSSISNSTPFSEGSSSVSYTLSDNGVTTGQCQASVVITYPTATATATYCPSSRTYDVTFPSGYEKYYIALENNGTTSAYGEVTPDGDNQFAFIDPLTGTSTLHLAGKRTASSAMTEFTTIVSTTSVFSEFTSEVLNANTASAKIQLTKTSDGTNFKWFVFPTTFTKDNQPTDADTSSAVATGTDATYEPTLDVCGQWVALRTSSQCCPSLTYKFLYGPFVCPSVDAAHWNKLPNKVVKNCPAGMDYDETMTFLNEKFSELPSVKYAGYVDKFQYSLTGAEGSYSNIVDEDNFLIPAIKGEESRYIRWSFKCNENSGYCDYYVTINYECPSAPTPAITLDFTSATYGKAMEALSEKINVVTDGCCQNCSVTTNLYGTSAIKEGSSFTSATTDRQLLIGTQYVGWIYSNVSKYTKNGYCSYPVTVNDVTCPTVKIGVLTDQATLPYAELVTQIKSQGYYFPDIETGVSEWLYSASGSIDASSATETASSSVAVPSSGSFKIGWSCAHTDGSKTYCSADVQVIKQIDPCNE